jgi:hypothetical protein
MSGIAAGMLLWGGIVTAEPPGTAETPPALPPGAKAPPALPPAATGASLAQVMSLFGQSQQRAKEAAAVPESPQPMFQFFGPDLRASFWNDPKAAGQVLLLQGELMVKMGETLIQQGRAMLEAQGGSSVPAAPAKP